MRTLGLALAGSFVLLIGPGCGVWIPPDELAAGVGAGKASALEQPRCNPVDGWGSTTDEDGDGVFVGSGALVIRGAEFEVSITTVLLAGPFEGDDGTLHATTSHTFSFDEENSFITTDKAILEPTDIPGVFTLNSNMKITSGTGMFEWSSGRLHAHGEIDLINGVTSFDINGVICRAEVPE